MTKFIIVLSLLLSNQAFADFSFATWNIKHLGRASLDLDKAAQLLNGYDLIAIQEVNTSPSGVKALTALASRLGAYCFGFSDVPSGSRERYAFLWKEAAIGFVKTNGEVVTQCPKYALTFKVVASIQNEVIREPAVGHFKDLSSGKKFLVFNIHAVPTAKKPEREIPYVIDGATREAGKKPFIIAGDFNLSCNHPSFALRVKSLSSAVSCDSKTSLKMKSRELNEPYDNIIYSGFTVSEGKVVSLYDYFPNDDHKSIYKTLSDHSPVTATFE